MKRFHSSQFSVESVTTDFRGAGLTAAALIPTYNEESTIANVVRTLNQSGLVRTVYVIDDGSVDNTVKEAFAAGAVVFERKKEGTCEYWRYSGKGFAVWKGIRLAKEDYLVVYDGDVRNPAQEHLAGLLGPMIAEPAITLCKASFDRNLYLQQHIIKKHGGRQTELLIKPLMGFLFPELVQFSQPTGGIYAASREHLAQLELLGEAGADLSVLVNHFRRFGLDSIAEVEIGEIRHRNKELDELARSCPKLIQSLFYLAKGVDEFNEHTSVYREGAEIRSRTLQMPLVRLPPKRSGQVYAPVIKCA